MAHGIRTGKPLTVDTTAVNATLRKIRASFVTLSLAGGLRGCTGTLEAVQPLAMDVAATACRTALTDPRFRPIQSHEVDRIEIELSVLSPLKAMPVRNEEDLLERLEPGIDGLVLEVGTARATFLPKVWEHLPAPREFLGELKRKAGLTPDFWSTKIALYRYHTETFSEAAT